MTIKDHIEAFITLVVISVLFSPLNPFSIQRMLEYNIKCIMDSIDEPYKLKNK